MLWGIWQGVPGFSSDGNFGQNSFGDAGALDFAWWAAFLVEIVTTLIFLLVILAVTDERNEHPTLAPLAIGLTLAMIHFTTISLTGSSLNPARSIGPALFAGGDAIVQLWLFILAPLLGGALAGLALPVLFGRHASRSRVRASASDGVRRPGAVPGYGAPDAYQEQWNQQYPQGQAPPQASLAAPGAAAVAAAAVPHRAAAAAVLAPAAASRQQPPQQPPARRQQPSPRRQPRSSSPGPATTTTARPRYVRPPEPFAGRAGASACPSPVEPARADGSRHARWRPPLDQRTGG